MPSTLSLHPITSSSIISKKALHQIYLEHQNILHKLQTLKNRARIKQRLLVITLLDLKNAFGEVHHNLIKTVLDYHHIPDQIKAIIENLFTDFQTLIITSEFWTPFIAVGLGVLEGEPIASVLSCSTCVLIHLSNALKQKNTNSLVSQVIY